MHVTQPERPRRSNLERFAALVRLGIKPSTAGRIANGSPVTMKDRDAVLVALARASAPGAEWPPRYEADAAIARTLRTSSRFRAACEAAK
jgi:hypothetical protein